MLAVVDMMLDEEIPRDRPALLLKQFSEIGAECDPRRVLYPLRVTSPSIAAPVGTRERSR